MIPYRKPHHFTLDENNEPVPHWSITEMVEAWDIEKRRTAETYVGKVHVSTVFLCIDHNYSSGPPVLWETMVFGGALDQEQWRYSSHVLALIGHDEVVALVRKSEVWWRKLWRALNPWSRSND